MEYGVQSMTGTLERALLVPPADTCLSSESEVVSQSSLRADPAPEWELDPDACAIAGWHQADSNGLLQQFDRFRELLVGSGVDVRLGTPADRANPDAIYAFDPVMVTRAGVIVLRSAKSNREAEPRHLERDLHGLGLPTLGRLEPPAVMDAGDSFWLRPDRLIVGLSWRTNRTAATQLSATLRPLGVSVEAFDVVHFRGPAFCLHLLSLISLLTPELAIAYARLLPARLVATLNELGVELLEVPSEEFSTLGTNVLSLGEGRVVALGGNPIAHQRMRKKGLDVRVFDGPDLCLAGDGGPTCLTLPLFRGDVDVVGCW